jgi:hypothetical protein
LPFPYTIPVSLILIDRDYTTFLGITTLGLSIGEERQTPPPRFFGTSASASSVAAVGIILLQACTLLKEGRLLDGAAAQGGVDVRRKLKDIKTSKKRKQRKTDSPTGPTDSPTGAPTLPPFDCSLPANIFRIIEETAIDMDEIGFDFSTGSGFVNALAAIERLIELVEGNPSASAATNYDEGQCPIPNFLFPIESFFD